jgi:hypothetical protein
VDVLLRSKREAHPGINEDWQEANKKLRERLGARDNRVLEIVRKGEQMGFEPWVEFFLENYSKPPIRAAKTHNANQRATKHLKAAFQGCKLADLTADGIELYLRKRLRDRVRNQDNRRLHRARRTQAGDGSSGTAGVAAHVERCRSKETIALQSLHRGGVPGCSQRLVPPSLPDVVGTTQN